MQHALGSQSKVYQLGGIRLLLPAACTLLGRNATTSAHAASSAGRGEQDMHLSYSRYQCTALTGAGSAVSAATRYSAKAAAAPPHRHVTIVSSSDQR